ncbi:3-hydroxyacyl-CoA dehydrogenase NAD-binding domain-containing protein [Sphingomonas crocodyli]|uniref:3-hydroxyacyl-CoA dehydrogenase n=1 Tax=Sphingomonas crocodyli TaxID=1979270 RepID=A0A437M927_9SPHN|nr:3-hydroxyacyl-CoA dehydrogenase NAD-binding domain-containing protein [Sphingomonas crocodyli]RVT94220.1 3-hydroxyacyl-CoA dehydrogenase [Sphingomonas crocodyli]
MTISTIERDGDVALLLIDSPPVNALGAAVRNALDAGLKALVADDAVRAIVIRCRGRTFFAGADISEFGKPLGRPDLNDIFAVIEGSTKPVISAIHGTALGGGFELALACHGRIASADAKVGLPEVSLGLLPGAGGTQRTPRIAGVERALDLIVGGAPIGARRAHELGLIDEIAIGDLRADAVAYARTMAAERRLPRIRDRAPDLDVEAAKIAIAAYRERNPRSFVGFKAPDLILQSIEAAVTLDFDAGLKREWELFEQAMATPESAAQRHIFFAERAAAKVQGLPADAKPLPVVKVAVIGAGTMGSGIATAFLNIGLSVTLVDRDAGAVERGAGGIAKTLRALAEKGRIKAEEAERRIGLLNTGTEIGVAVADADLAIEAVYEDMALKQAIFRELDQAAKPGAILASNTSFLDLDAIAAVTGRPDRVIGLHFFAPANIMRLLEVVRGAKTAPEVVATGMALGRKLGKVAILSGVCHGFIANRIMQTCVDAAQELLLAGVMPWRIDRVMTDYGMAMGVFTMLDLVGVDVIGWDRANSAGRTVQEVLCEADRWGQKKGAGYYDYDDRRRPTPSLWVEQVVRDFAAKSGVEPRDYSDAELLERLFYPIVNEGAKVLDEGIAQRASDIDIAMVTGYGWPVYRGGPMIWGDQTGLPKIVAALDARGADVSPLLRRHAGDGTSFTA